MENYQQKVKIEERLFCDGCGEEVYQCPKCKEYEMADTIIYCTPDEGHLCESCFEEYYEERDNELKAKQEVKNE